MEPFGLVYAAKREDTLWNVYRYMEFLKTVKYIIKDKNSYDNERSIYMMLKPLMEIHKPNILMFLGAQERYDVSKEFWIVTEYHEVGSLSDFLIKFTLVSLLVVSGH